MPSIPRGSIEYLHVPISITDSSEEPLEDLDVLLALLVDGQAPTGSTAWSAATFSSGVARWLLPAELASGRYAVWVKIAQEPELVLRKAGVLTVT